MENNVMTPISTVSTVIPERLIKAGAGFVKLGGSTKIPAEKGWQNAPHTAEEIISWVGQGNNYGVLCGHGGLIVVDTDDAELTNLVKEKFPKTFTVRTPRKGYHFYFFCPEFARKVVLHREEDTNGN